MCTNLIDIIKKFANNSTQVLKIDDSIYYLQNKESFSAYKQETLLARLYTKYTKSDIIVKAYLELSVNSNSQIYSKYINIDSDTYLIICVYGKVCLKYFLDSYIFQIFEPEYLNIRLKN